MEEKMRPINFRFFLATPMPVGKTNKKYKPFPCASIVNRVFMHQRLMKKPSSFIMNIYFLVAFVVTSKNAHLQLRQLTNNGHLEIQSFIALFQKECFLEIHYTGGMRQWVPRQSRGHRNRRPCVKATSLLAQTN